MYIRGNCSVNYLSKHLLELSLETLSSLYKWLECQAHRIVCNPTLNSSLDAVFVLIVTSSCSSSTMRCQCLPHLLSRTGETCYAPPGLAIPHP